MNYFISIFVRNLSKDKFSELVETLGRFAGKLEQAEKDIVVFRTEDLNIISCLLQMRQSYADFRYGFSQYLGIARGLSKTAKPGEVLISEEIEKKIIENYELTSLGMLTLEGMKSQILVCRVEAPMKKLEFPQLKLPKLAISRKAEIESFGDLMRVSRAILITGPTGIGKTTFLDQLTEHWQKRAVFRTTCSSYLLGPILKPIMDIVAQILGIYGVRSMEEKQKNIEKRLKELEITDIGTSYLAILDFLGLGEEESILEKLELTVRVEVITETIFEILKRLSWTKPVVIIIEDVENMDASSLNFLQHLMTKLVDENVCFIFSATLSLVNIQGLKEFELREIGSDRLAKLVEEWTGEQINLPATTLFHVAQYCYFYNEAKLSYFYRQYTGETSIASFGLSFYDLKTIIKRRLEFLGDEKDLLFTLVVAGTEISTDELPIEKKNLDWLNYFVKCGYLRKSFDKYIFQNPLLHSAIYEQVPDKQKRHQRLADYYSRIEGYEELAAFHYREEGNYKKAIEFLMKSGNLAVWKGAYESGINYYHQALEICQRQGETTDLELLVSLNEGLADIYRALGDEKKALKFYKVVLDSYKEILKE